MDTSSEFRIEEVPVGVVRPLRLEYLRPGEALETVTYRSDENPTAKHFAARDGEGNVIGVGSLHMEDRVAGQGPYGSPGMRLRGMAVHEGWRQKGVGSGLLRAMLEVGQEAGVKEAWANARVENMAFYERTGFSEMSSEFELPQMGLHIVVALELEERPKKARRGKEAKDA